jgi:hypothetical protein
MTNLASDGNIWIPYRFLALDFIMWGELRRLATKVGTILLTVFTLMFLSARFGGGFATSLASHNSLSLTLIPIPGVFLSAAFLIGLFFAVVAIASAIAEIILSRKTSSFGASQPYGKKMVHIVLGSLAVIGIVLFGFTIRNPHAEKDLMTSSVASWSSDSGVNISSEQADSILTFALRGDVGKSEKSVMTSSGPVVFAVNKSNESHMKFSITSVIGEK